MEQSGNVALDQAVAAFTAHGFDDEGGIGVAHGWLSEEEWDAGVRVRLEHFRDPACVAGLCHALASQCADFLAAAGIDAWSSEDDGDNPDSSYFHKGPDDFGYHNRTLPGASNHCVTIAELDGQRFTIDFAAAQYGYLEFPLVQRLDHNERWELVTG